jgi:hypothetical protein
LAAVPSTRIEKNIVIMVDVDTLKTRYPTYKLQVKTEGQLRDRHVSCGPSSRCPARGSSGAATCPTDTAPAVQPGAASEPPRVLRTQLPLPDLGQPRGRHVSHGPSSRCPARGSSGAAACPAASALTAQPGAAPGSPRVPWKPSGRRAIKVTDIP